MTLDEVRASISRVLDAKVEIGPPPGEEPHQLSRMLGGNTRLADRFRDGRVLLVGDAAHVHSPIGGPGLNLGWKLPATVHGWAPPGLLDSHNVR